MKRRCISTTAPESAREIVRRALIHDDAPRLWTRTTFKAPAKTIEELKIFALRNGVDMNDLLLLGAHKVLRDADLPSHLGEADLPGIRFERRDDVEMRPKSA